MYFINNLLKSFGRTNYESAQLHFMSANINKSHWTPIETLDRYDVSIEYQVKDNVNLLGRNLETDLTKCNKHS